MSNLVTEFRARKSTQNLHFGLPSSLYLATNMAGTDHGDVISRITPSGEFSFHPLTHKELGTGVSLSVAYILALFGSRLRRCL